jgi:hypothetical protein
MDHSESDPLGDFFTTKRLKHYRKLHEQFPLWCGDWPREARYDPASYYWLTEFRLARYAHSLAPKSGVAWFEFDWPEPKWQNAPIPILKLGRPQSGQQTLREVEGSFSNPAEAALASTIKYTGALWRSGYGPAATGEPWLEAETSTLEEWAQLLERIIRRPDARFVGIKTQKGPTGAFLASLRRTYLAASPNDRKEREQLRKKLEDYWSWIGREAGILPRVAGGSETTFPDALLDSLASETQALIAKVRSFSSDSDEFGAVRRLLIAGDDPLTKEQRDLIEALERRDHTSAKKREQEMIDRTLRTDEWIRRLRFPILTAREIRNLREQRLNLHQSGQASAASAARLIAPHIDLSPKTVETKLSQFRRA